MIKPKVIMIWITDKHRLPILIWPSYDSLETFMKIIDKPELIGAKANYVSLDVKYWMDNKNQYLVSKIAGYINLVEGNFGAAVFSHELQHFINDWIHYNGLCVRNDNEQICYLVSDIQYGFWSCWLKKESVPKKNMVRFNSNKHMPDFTPSQIS